MTTAVQASAVSTQALIDSVNGTAGKAKTTSKIAEAQDRFLKLLTTQLKNQDPLSPMDNAQMTSQLAQISTVDGIEKLNATLQKLVSNSVDAEAMQAAALVGHQVMVEGSGLTLSSSGAIGGLDLPSPASQVVVSIKDVNGLVVKTLDLGSLGTGQHNFTWDGIGDAGSAAVAGTYRVTISAKQGTEGIAAQPLELVGVRSINRSSQGVSLDLGHLGLASLSDIKQIF